MCSGSLKGKTFLEGGGTLFFEPGGLHKAWKRAERSSRRGLPWTGMEICLTMAWILFGMAGSEDDYREGQGAGFTW